MFIIKRHFSEDEKILTKEEQLFEYKKNLDPKKKNRKQRKLELALKRNNFKKYREPNYWIKRVIREMKDNKTVQENVTSGKLDKYLK